MTNEQMLAEIREANLTYLMLAQSLIRQDRAAPMATQIPPSVATSNSPTELIGDRE